MTAPLLPTRFLFRFSTPCRRCDPLWTAEGTKLDESYRLAGLAELEGKTAWADLRAAWNDTGLAFAVLVRGKRQPPWCRVAQPEESDGLHLWIDTRDVHNVHRAGRFCHRFFFLPDGGKTGKTAAFSPASGSVPIHRSREQPRPIAPAALQCRSQRLADGYRLDAFVAAFRTLGYEPCESADVEEGFEKIAIYTWAAGTPKHAARQLPDGLWTSKLGPHRDIKHELSGLEGRNYGMVKKIMKRKISLISDSRMS